MSLAVFRLSGGAHAHTSSSRPSTTFPACVPQPNFHLINARPVVVWINIGVFFSSDFTKSHFVTVKLLWISVSIDFFTRSLLLGARAAPWQQLTHFVNSISAFYKNGYSITITQSLGLNARPFLDFDTRLRLFSTWNTSVDTLCSKDLLFYSNIFCALKTCSC